MVFFGEGSQNFSNFLTFTLKLIIKKAAMYSEIVHTPLEWDRYYHIYNRGNNYEKIFFEEMNYHFFLKKYEHYISDYADTLSYCLLNNHFHLVIKTKNNPIAPQKILSEQFRKFFISYTMAVNKRYKRSGNLLLRNFKRKKVDTESYLKKIIYYVHFNPAKHGITENYQEYKYSSYKALISEGKTKLAKDFVLNDIFNGRTEFIEYHEIAELGC